MFKYFKRIVNPKPIFTRKEIEEVLLSCSTINSIHFAIEFINDDFFIIRIVDNIGTLCFKCFSIGQLQNSLGMYMRGFNNGVETAIINFQKQMSDPYFVHEEETMIH